MRTVLFVSDHGDFKAGQVAAVDDQTACGAIAQGNAVPSIEAPHVAPAPATVVEPMEPELKPDAGTVQEASKVE